MLVVTRFFAGVGIGAELPIADSYLSDLLPPRDRGRYIAWAYTLGFLGVPASGFLARGLAPIAPLGIEGWRWMFVVGALGSVVVALLRRSLPESPRWLAANGRGEEADAVVRRFEADVPATELPEPDPVHPEPMRDRGRSASCGPTVPQAHRDDGGVPAAAELRLLRVRHARAAGARGQGLPRRAVARGSRR